jgi:hypothetical protein
MDKITATQPISARRRTDRASSLGAIALAHSHKLRGQRKQGRGPNSEDGFAWRIADYLLHPDKAWDKAREVVDGILEAALPWTIALLALSALTAAALWMLRARARRGNNERARRLRILVPPEVAADGGDALWTGLHGLIRPRLKALLYGQPALVWEVRARPDDVEVSLWIPGNVPVGYIERAIESAWPGVTVVESSPGGWEPEEGAQVRTCELVLARSQSLPLGGESALDPLRLALAALTNLSGDESSVVQVVARPAPARRARALIRAHVGAPRRASGARSSRTGRPTPVPQRDPTADAELRAVHAKAAAPLFDCSIRIAMSAKTRASATARIHSAASAFAMYDGMNSFRRKRLLRGAHAIKNRTVRRSVVLSVPEFAAIATLPQSEVPGMDVAGARIVAAPRALPQDGRVLGHSNRGIAGGPVALGIEDARHHVHLLGQTGTGKSTLLARLILQDAAAGRAAVVIDPKGDLIEAVMARLPQGAEERTCLIDPTDPSVSVGLNVFHGADPELATDHVASLFKRIYENHWGPRSDDILRASCLTLAQIKGATLAEIPLLLTSARWRVAIRSRLHDPALRLFWEQFDAKAEARRQDDISPLMNKLRAFLLRGAIRTIVGQDEPRRDIESLIESRGLILVRIPKGLIGEDTSRLLGGLVIARVWQAAMARASAAEASRADVALYVDEMHNYLSLPRSFEDLLAEARGYRLSLVLAHQHLGQLKRDMRDALAANARTKVVFACSPEDARALEAHFAPRLAAHDLAHLPAFTAACRPCLQGGNGAAFTFATEPLPAGSESRSLAVRIASGERFGRKRSEVESGIRARQLRPEIALLPSPTRSLAGHSLGQSVDRSLDHSGAHSSVAEPPIREPAGQVS